MIVQVALTLISGGRAGGHRTRRTWKKWAEGGERTTRDAVWTLIRRHEVI